MARKKLAMRVRYERRQCRDTRRAIAIQDSPFELTMQTEDPCEQVMSAELVQRAYELMDAETREIARQRSNDSTWPEIASSLGGTADSRRKQYERALDRIAITLGVEDSPLRPPPDPPAKCKAARL
jgi:hypothetical protein